MIRSLVRGGAAFLIVALAIEAVVGQPPGSPDRIYVLNRKDGSTKTFDGTLKLSAAGLQILGTDGKLLTAVAPADILKVVPGELPGLDRNLVLNLIASEEKQARADLIKARDGYLELQVKTTTAPERTKRYVDFKAALLSTRVADDSADDEKWAEQTAEAVKSWGSFLNQYKSGWEVWVAARTLTRLQAELGRYDEAARVWNRLTRKDADLPPDLRLEAGIEEIDSQIRQKLYPSALESAKTLFASTPPGPGKDKLDLYQTAAKFGVDAAFVEGAKAIETKLAASKDPTVRGVGYGMMGELLLAGGKPRDAMWAFLWVETVYNADKYAAFKAMCRLADIFKSFDDEDRYRTYREKIRRLRSAL